MTPILPTIKAEREKKLKSLLNFATTLAKRFESNISTTLIDDIASNIRGLPLQSSLYLTAKQDDLDKTGTELWNLSTRLLRDEIGLNGQPRDIITTKNRSLCLLRVFSFLILDTAATQVAKDRKWKSLVRLMKIALKAATVCIRENEIQHAMKVLERAAEYEDILSKSCEGENDEEIKAANHLKVEYFAIRITLAWRQDRMDMAEHMYAKCKEVRNISSTDSTEKVADLLYELGKDALTKCKYETALCWLERAQEVIGDANSEIVSPGLNELRLSTMHAIVRAHMKMKTLDAREKAWQIVRSMEPEFGDKMAVLLLKIELLSETEPLDNIEFYNVLLRMMRTIVLNDANFKTIMHYILKLKEHSSKMACKVIDNFIDMRLFREENQSWIEKAIITRIWVNTPNDSPEDVIEQLQEVFDSVHQNSKMAMNAPATHAAQTLLWKRVETAVAQQQHAVADAWCRLCLHPIFEQAGVQNRARIIRKMIQCALLRGEYAAARDAHSKMPETGKNEAVTRYLMYKVALREEDAEFATECLDYVCRSSDKDPTLLYACIVEAQSIGDKRQAINALEKVLDKYNFSAPAGVHLPALLRCTARLLQSELVEDGMIDVDILKRLCVIFEGACAQAKASQRRPSTPAQKLFTKQEFEWFSNNAYNLSLKHCAEMSPIYLVRLLETCIEFTGLLRQQVPTSDSNDFCLRLVFCEFLVTCTYITLARAEDNISQSLQYYLEARKHSREFRLAAEGDIDKLDGPAQADIISKHFQIVKLELEAVLKLRKWDELDDLFDQCWRYKSPDHYESLADLVLIIHAEVAQAKLDAKYQKKVLAVLQKIIGLANRQAGSDMTKLSRWLRCLFSLSLEDDEKTSLKCIEQVAQLAAIKQGEIDQYPKVELEWLATTTFNHAIDYYILGDDEKCKIWAEKSFVLAQWLEDNDAVRDLLMNKFSKLNWEK